MWRIASATSTGSVRDTNEDRISICGRRTVEGPAIGLESKAPNQYVLIADGMGGHAKGEVASHMALTKLEALHRQLLTEDGVAVALRAANRAIYEAAMANGEFLGMGTTIVGVAIEQRRCRWFNVGDSRAYLSRDRNLTQISKDHVPAVLAGGRRDHSITQSLGGGRFFTEILPSQGEFEVQEGDRILLCTDGLTDVVGDVEIERILGRDDPAPTLERLIARCFELGAPDNISLALMEFESAP
ncbi:protein phosphatase 2C domain-containing protein [Devosia sp. FJ2-5-3]|uniref:PP2C family protein-serine/threonine phosphatase n=1 Tax=Devosia sp. FJ2-5-3 TaxID=2976680 RepID=UPI0023D81133|nr:protein phosphatase 2C domain-containing protein [Devosia sp. FJ2-5-3]WEJ57477.1 protein phosphatase 2C domain-containing protein [Devosia sp. FJ2-5-3]